MRFNCLPSSLPTVLKTSSTLSRPMLPTRWTFTLALFRLDADVAHHFRPGAALGLDEGIHRRRRPGAIGEDAEVAHARLRGGVLQHFVHLRIHALHDVGRRA